MSDSLWSFDTQQPPARDWDDESDEDEEERSEDTRRSVLADTQYMTLNGNLRRNKLAIGHDNSWGLNIYYTQLWWNFETPFRLSFIHISHTIHFSHELLFKHHIGPQLLTWRLLPSCHFPQFLKYASGSKGTDASPETQNSSLKVVILTSLPLSSYLSPHSTDRLPAPLVRSLSTEPYLVTLDRPAPQLEVPNIVTGIAAASKARKSRMNRVGRNESPAKNWFTTVFVSARHVCLFVCPLTSSLNRSTDHPEIFGD
uniref:Proteasome assembly chaperone 1 n=1 Tax=Eptatretus burgeri TaxID=7764 RepID=A0A8C4QLP9_EPTBU